MKLKRKISIPLSNEGKLKITKIEAAVYQLETAIDLWFVDGDPSSMTTLAYSAHEIIYQLNRASPTAVKSLANIDPDLIQEGPLKQALIDQWQSIFKLDYNFCKHGGADPDEVHYMVPQSIPLAIMDAVQMFMGLSFQRRAVFQNFMIWQWLTISKVFPTKPYDLGIPSHAIESAIQAGKVEFYKVASTKLSPSFVQRGGPVIRNTT